MSDQSKKKKRKRKKDSEKSDTDVDDDDSIASTYNRDDKRKFKQTTNADNGKVLSRHRN